MKIKKNFLATIYFSGFSRENRTSGMYTHMEKVILQRISSHNCETDMCQDLQGEQ